MSTITIELDTTVVQEAVHAKVQPAVDRVLADVDLPALIEKALLTESKAPRYGMSGVMLAMMYEPEPKKPIEWLVDRAIHEAAKTYVENHVERERLKIEDAFEKMMRNSASKLAKTMFAAIQNGMKNEWQFAIETHIEPKELERSDWDD